MTGHELRVVSTNRHARERGPIGRRTDMSSDPVPAVAAVRASPRPPVTGIWAWVVQRRRWIWLMLSSAGLVLAVQEVVGSRAELLSAIGDLRRVSWTWLGVAILAEWCSYTAVAFAQRRLLRAGGVTVRVGTLGRLAVASQAMGSVLPVGYLVSNVVVLGGLTRRGVGKMLALWMLAMVGLLYIVTLVLIGLVGAQLAPPSKDVPDLRVVAAIVLGVVIGGFVAVVAVNRMRRRPWSMRELAARMPGGGRIKRLIGGDVLAELSLGPRGWSVGFGWMLLYWAGDVACLAVAFFAVGGILPWRGFAARVRRWPARGAAADHPRRSRLDRREHESCAGRLYRRDDRPGRSPAVPAHHLLGGPAGRRHLLLVAPSPTFGVGTVCDEREGRARRGAAHARKGGQVRRSCPSRNVIVQPGYCAPAAWLHGSAREGRHFVQADPEILGEPGGFGDRPGVGVDPDAAFSVVRDEGDHRGAAGERAERVHVRDPRACDVHRVRHAGDIGHLDVVRAG